MPYDMNAGRNKRKHENTDTTENQMKLREQIRLRNQALDAESRNDGQDRVEPDEQPEEPTGMAAEKPCFITVAIPESVKRIVDMKVKYDSKDLPLFNQTIKHVGRRWFLRGLLAEGLITQEQYDEASTLHSEYGWERDRISEKRRKR